MKMPTFLKIILSFLVLFFFLLLWMNQWRYEANGFLKINRITGEVYKLQSDGGEWISLKKLAEKREGEEIIRQAREARETKEAEEARKRLESFTDILVQEYLENEGLLNKDGSINREALKKRNDEASKKSKELRK